MTNPPAAFERPFPLVHFVHLEGGVPRTITTTELRLDLKRVLDEVRYGQSRYLVARHGQPTAAIISVEDFRLLQALGLCRPPGSLPETFAAGLLRGGGVAPEELEALIQEACAALDRTACGAARTPGTH